MHHQPVLGILSVVIVSLTVMAQSFLLVGMGMGGGGRRAFATGICFPILGAAFAISSLLRGEVKTLAIVGLTLSSVFGIAWSVLTLIVTK